MPPFAFYVPTISSLLSHKGLRYTISCSLLIKADNQNSQLQYYLDKADYLMDPDQADKDVLYRLAHYYKFSFIGPEGKAEYLSFIKQAAIKGHSEALLELSQIYGNGLFDTPVNYFKAQYYNMKSKQFGKASWLHWENELDELELEALNLLVSEEPGVVPEERLNQHLVKTKAHGFVLSDERKNQYEIEKTFGGNGDCKVPSAADRPATVTEPAPKAPDGPASMADQEEKTPDVQNPEPRKTALERGLPNITIAVVGEHGVGKTTLTAAITKVLYERYGTEYKPVSVQQLDNRPEEQLFGGTIDTSVIEYRTQTRHYTHIDCPGHPRYFKNALWGIQMADACILVISAANGLNMATVNLMRHCPEGTIVFLNNTSEMDQEIIELLQMEIEEYRWGRHLIIGSAQKALENPNGPDGDTILNLMKELEAVNAVPERDTKGSFVMEVYKVYRFLPKGRIITGFIKSGSVQAGDSLELVGYNNAPFTVTAKEIQCFHKARNSASAGECVGILIDDNLPVKLKRGQLFVTPGTRAYYNKITANVKLYLRDGQKKEADSALTNQYEYRVGLSKATGTILFFKEYDRFKSSSGQQVVNYFVEVQLSNYVPFRKNDELLLLENNSPVGYGEILSVDNSEFLLRDDEKEKEAAPGQETEENGLEEKNSVTPASEIKDKANDAEEQYNQGMRYIDDKGTQDYAKAVDCFRIAAEQGHVLAQFQLGECYRIGRGVEKDIPIALSWLEKAAQQGHAQAQNNYGFCHVLGRGVEKDYEKGFYWLEKAAAQGHAEAQNNLGYFYKFGVGVEKDYEKAIHWYELSARQGNAAAQYGLGRSYESEAGVAKDLEKAIYWYKQAAMQGFALAQNQLGICYSFYKNNYPEAFFWYKKAAEQGVDNSMYALGNYYSGYRL